MKNIRIQHTKNDYAVEFKSNDQAFIESEIARITAKEQLFKHKREIVEFSGPYEEADVESRRSEEIPAYVVNEDTGEIAPAVTINYVTLRANYEVTIKDLSEDYAWLLAECYRQRLAEYPTLSEISEALMEKFGENRIEKFNEIHQKRMAVKAKYKKPSKD